MRIKALLLGLAGVATAAPVSAQDMTSFFSAQYANAYGGYLQGTITGAVLNNAYGGGKGEARQSERKLPRTIALTATPTSGVSRPVQLPFTHSAAVSRRVRQELIDNVRKIDASAAAEIERALAGGQALQVYAQGVRPLGLRANDTLDAMTAYLMTSWAVANNTDFTPTPAMARAVRGQVANAYPGLTEMLKTGAQRQEVAESLIYQTLIHDSLLERMKMMPGAERRATADKVHQTLLPILDYDLRRMQLTTDGFRDRRSGEAGPAGPGADEAEELANSEEGRPSYALLAAAGGVGLGAAFLLGKAAARKGSSPT